MDEVNSNNVSHPSSHTYTLLIHWKRSLLPSPWFCTTIPNVLCKWNVLVCYAPRSVERVMPRSMKCVLQRKWQIWTCKCTKLFHINNVCNQVVFLPTHVMPRFYNSMQTPFCALPTLTWLVGCAWIFFYCTRLCIMDRHWQVYEFLID